MLVLSRKQGQQVVIGRDIVVTVLGIQGGRVKLGFSGPAEVPIHRQELRQQIDADDRPAAEAAVAALRYAECA